MISLTRAEIEALIRLPQAAEDIEAAYRATSAGNVNLPPVGHITFPEDADCHIKYGHLAGAPNFVIKIATGFPKNAERGLQGGNGLVLVLSATTGATEAVLHDEMLLTDIRTGLGGAIASKTLARADSEQALIVGTGPQARRQIEAHVALLPGLSFCVWARNSSRVAELAADMAPLCDVEPAPDLKTAVQNADLIVTATGSTAPLLQSGWVQPGTHITAVGADAPGKQELDVALVARANVLVADLLSQCLDHGEISHASREGLIQPGNVKELGAILSGTHDGRANDSQITIADLTGIAAQDIAMANAVLTAWNARSDKTQSVDQASPPPQVTRT